MSHNLPLAGSSEEGHSSQEPDQQLIQRVQSGDVGAFDLLIEKYKMRIYGVIYHMLGNHEDAADLSQETFVKAFKSIHSFRSKSNFYTWLYRIAVNSTLNFIKKKKDHFFSLNEMDSSIEDQPVLKELTCREGVNLSMDREELQEKLNEALQKLSKQHRTVVVLHDIEGMKHQEIAKILGCSEATARSRLFYAHQQLQALLANYI